MSPAPLREFQQIRWSPRLATACQRVFESAREEDLADVGDLTSLATIPAEQTGAVVFRLREAGVVAGLPTLEIAATCYDPRLRLTLLAHDGDALSPGAPLVRLEGPARSILAVERPALNLLSRLSGIATQTRAWVDRIAGHPARIYDTRKTTPGLRLLEKYAVRCGGGTNHRTGLFDAVLIKDNHLALGGESQQPLSPRLAIERARRFLADQRKLAEHRKPSGQETEALVEIEVDTWDQFVDALAGRPDIILLDNMPCEQMAQAVSRRDSDAPQVQLEASGGITPERLGEVAATGVDRISLGALTHSATQIDIGLDWVVESD